MSLFKQLDEDSILLSRIDPNQELGSCSKHGFHLDDAQWPSVEHYYQAMKYKSPDFRDRIRNTHHPKEARKLGNSWLRKKRPDWKRARKVVMTRAVYIKCRTHPEVAKLLLETGDRQLVNNGEYDYFWGCGRDGRGHNTYGKVLMSVRSKLREEQMEAASQKSSGNQ